MHASIPANAAANEELPPPQAKRARLGSSECARQDVATTDMKDAVRVDSENDARSPLPLRRRISSPCAKRATDSPIAIDDSDCELCTEAVAIPRKRRSHTLRISAGRAAAAAGLHPFVDAGDLFLELLYQHSPELLTRDAELLGLELVSPVAERAELLAQSGQSQALEAALDAARKSADVEGAAAARAAVATSVERAVGTQRMTAEQAAELRTRLEQEINQEFGTRHEDAALHAYEARIGHQVFGQQQRVVLSLPAGGPQNALLTAFPPASKAGTRKSPKSESETVLPVPSCAREDAYFLLTGFIDGLAPVATIGTSHSADKREEETVVVEVKHRMTRIKDPPEIYDVVQLCSYCRALGICKGDLVQCLREEGGSGSKAAGGTIHVTRLDFSAGTSHRRGWDDHVLPGLYSLADAVYAAREDEGQRYRLLASSPEERTALVAELCPHLAR